MISTMSLRLGTGLRLYWSVKDWVQPYEEFYRKVSVVAIAVTTKVAINSNSKD